MKEDMKILNMEFPIFKNSLIEKIVLLTINNWKIMILYCHRQSILKLFQNIGIQKKHRQLKNML